MALMYLEYLLRARKSTNCFISVEYDFSVLELNSSRIGIEKGSPKNSQGFYESGNYGWNGTSSQFELKNVNGSWDKYTWHHVEDGKTMIPVLSNVHSPGAGGFVHPGGNAIIQGGIKGIFLFTGF